MPSQETIMLGAAVDRLRLSHGMRNKQLAAAANIPVMGLTDFEAGRRTLNEETMTRIENVLNVEPGQLVAEARKIPDITKPAVAEAFFQLLKVSPDKTAYAVLEKECGLTLGSLAHFVQNKDGLQEHTCALETVFPVAVKLGYASFGDLLLKHGFPSAPLKPEPSTASRPEPHESWQHTVKKVQSFLARY